MSDLLAYAERVWSGEDTLAAYFSGEFRKDGLQPVAEKVWMWTATGNVYIFSTPEGLLLFDTGDRHSAEALHDAVRLRSALPVTVAIYSHGHVDHVFGAAPFDAEAGLNSAPPVSVISHEAVPARFSRYRITAGYNGLINQRQFRAPGLTWPTAYRYPDRTYTDTLTIEHGGLSFQLKHGCGETDDATVAWVPDRKILCCGDFYAWNAPNAGNPQKVQRYVAEWADMLRWMAGLGAELLLPGHGVPVVGAERIAQTLLGSSAILTGLHDGVLEQMNAGATLNEILHSGVITSEIAELLSRPYLRPSYDDPEFIIHNIWRRYGGWYDGDPSSLAPPRRRDLAAEIADLAGGSRELAQRALRLAGEGKLRLAGHLAELAALSGDPDAEVHRARAEVFQLLERRAPSFMAKGIYAWAVAESKAKADGSDDPWDGLQGGRWAP